MKGYAMLGIGKTGWIEKERPLCAPLLFVLDSLLSVFLIAQGRFLQVRKLHRIVKRIPVPTRSTNITGPHTKASTSDMILLNISISPL